MDGLCDLYFTKFFFHFQAAQGLSLVAGTVGIKILIAKILNIADDVSVFLKYFIYLYTLSIWTDWPEWTV